MGKQMWGYIYRKFGGKRYRIGQWYDTKAEAERAAKQLRQRGWQIRVTSRVDSQGKKKWVTWGRAD